MTNLVFVYGTLKKGYGNNSVLGNSKFLGEAVTIESFILTDCGFPYMIVPESLSEDVQRPFSAPVVGEVYKVGDAAVQASLDALEGVGYNHYRHHKLDVSMNGEVIPVIAYVTCDPTNAISLPVCQINGEGYYLWT